jgi:hypothetical protein
MVNVIMTVIRVAITRGVTGSLGALLLLGLGHHRANMGR